MSINEVYGDKAPPRRRVASERAAGDAAAQHRSGHRARCNRRRRSSCRCCCRRRRRRRCRRRRRRRRTHGSAEARPPNWQPIRWRHSSDHPIPLGEVHQPDGERTAGVPLWPGPNGCATAWRLHAAGDACGLRNAAGTIVAVPCSSPSAGSWPQANGLIPCCPCASCCVRRRRRLPWPPFGAWACAVAISRRLRRLHSDTFLHAGAGMHLTSVPSAGQGPHGAPSSEPRGRARRRALLSQRSRLYVLRHGGDPDAPRAYTHGRAAPRWHDRVRRRHRLRGLWSAEPLPWHSVPVWTAVVDG